MIRHAWTGGNTMAENSIFANGGLGIDLEADGVIPNDPGDLDKSKIICRTILS